MIYVVTLDWGDPHPREHLFRRHQDAVDFFVDMSQRVPRVELGERGCRHVDIRGYSWYWAVFDDLLQVVQACPDPESGFLLHGQEGAHPWGAARVIYECLPVPTPEDIQDRVARVLHNADALSRRLSDTDVFLCQT